ncbi:MAG: benzoate/H(+) symporter BenE family transporter [Rhodospirillales bacterium]
MHLEPIQRPLTTLKNIVEDISLIHISNAIIAFLFAASAPVAIILGVGIKGGLSEDDIASWIFGAFVLNGILGIIVSFIYRQPLVFFWTISGTVLVGPALEHLS